jgi:Flp pilus assembly pilin Flp
MSMNSHHAVAALMRGAATVTKSEEGQDLLEYALLVALIALVAMASVAAAGESVSRIFDAISDKLAAMA